MSLTLDQEHTLIVEAQAGDATAKLTLLAEYRGNIQAVIIDSVGTLPKDQERRDDLESELIAEFLQTLTILDPDTDTRVWAAFGRTGIFQALENFRRSEYALSGDGMDRMLRRVAQVERRMGEQGETVDQACEHVQISPSTFLAMQAANHGMSSDEVDEGRKDRFGKTVAPYAAGYRSDSVADAETALFSMTELQQYLVTYKYGFQPADFNDMELEEQAVNAAERDALPAYGRTEGSVARWYTVQTEKPLTRSGGTVLSQQSVSNEIREALETGAEAITKYYA